MCNRGNYQKSIPQKNNRILEKPNSGFLERNDWFCIFLESLTDFVGFFHFNGILSQLVRMFTFRWNSGQVWNGGYLKNGNLGGGLSVW